MLQKQVKNRQRKNIIREINYYKKVYPNNTEKIKELRKRLKDLINNGLHCETQVRDISVNHITNHSN